MKIREIENYGFKILNEKAKDGSMTVYAKFSEAEKRNQNSRIYPLEILTREVDRVQSKINAGQFLGQSDHSLSPQTFLKDVSHVVTKLEMIGNNGYATIRILNTDAGRNVQEIIRGKGKIGISSRSVGTVSASGVIQKDLRLLALDLVANPSVEDATIGKENILEGIEFSEKNEDKTMKNLMGLSQDYVQELMESCYEIYQKEENFKGTFSDFEKQMGNAILAEILVSEGKCANTEEALKHLGVDKGFEQRIINAINSDKEAYLGDLEGGEKTSNQKLTEGQISARTHGYFLEAQAGGFLGDFSEWKEKFPRLIEMAKEVKVVVEKKAEVKVPFKSKSTWAEIQLSGFRGTIQEYKEQFSNIEIIPVESAQEKVVVEEVLTEKTLKQEAGRIFVALKEENPDSSVTLESVMKMLKIEEEKKVDIRIKRKAVQIVSHDMFNSGGDVDEAKMEKMVKAEVERLTEERAEKKRKNWQAYQKLLD